MKRITRALVVLSLLATIGLSVAATASAEPSSSPRRVVICQTSTSSASGHWYGAYRQRPRACVFHRRGAEGFTGNLEVDRISWDQWGRGRARGSGWLQHHPVRIYLEQPEWRCGRTAFNSVVLKWMSYGYHELVEEQLPQALYGPTPNCEGA